MKLKIVYKIRNLICEKISMKEKKSNKVLISGKTQKAFSKALFKMYEHSSIRLVVM